MKPRFVSYYQFFYILLHINEYKSNKRLLQNIWAWTLDFPNNSSCKIHALSAFNFHHNWLELQSVFITIRYGFRNCLRDYSEIFQNMGGSSQFPILVCQIHFEVLKHVLHTGGGNIWTILSPKVHLILSLRHSFREENESPIPKSKCQNIGKMLTFWWKPKMFLRA